MADPLDSPDTPLPAPTSPSASDAAAPSYDATAVAGEINKAYTEWKNYRSAHEGDWFVNAAMLRGQQHVVYDQTNAQLVAPDAPTYATRLDINKILPKHRARMARFFKNRPKPIVVPASTEYQDLMDARATVRALEYQWQRLRLESAYRDARQWSAVGSKAYWWIGYDPNVMGRVQMVDPVTGDKRAVEALLGDVFVEVGNVWEVLVKDPTQAHIGAQPEIMRVRTLPRAEAERRFPALADRAAKHATSAADTSNMKQAEDLIAGLTSNEGITATKAKRENHVLLKEHFIAPCGKYPKGRSVVVCDDLVVKYEEELPFQFWDSPTNPYPCVEFSDTGNVGQFWNTTWIAQLIPLQRLLNRLLELVAENTEAVGRPKIIVYKQHGLADGAWTNSAGEIVELNFVPGLPEPRIIQPASVVGDLWNLLNFVLRQFDDISQIQTASEGGGGGTESGYQVNLLQEASDAVHAPDIRGDELAIEDAAWKIRRIMKLTWDAPRLIALGGQAASMEMLEFSNLQINDAAEVRIQIGSMMPDLKAAKAQTALNYYKEGLFGDPADPMVKRKALAMIDLGGYEVVNEDDRLDEDEAQRENQLILEGGVPEQPWPWQQHAVHAQKHEAKMKTPEWQVLPDERKRVGIGHLIQHYDYLNAALAMGLRQQFGMNDLPVVTPPPPPTPPSMPEGMAPPSAEPAPPSAPGAPAPLPFAPNAPA